MLYNVIKSEQPSNQPSVDHLPDSWGNKLFLRATNKLKQWEPELTSLAAIGISKKAAQLTTSQTVVTYPSINNLPIAKTDRLLPNTPPSGPATLYVHIPFCTGICTYCAYARSAPNNYQSKIDAYLKLLEQEAAILRKQLGNQRLKIDSIYLGGGTPTLLDPDQLTHLFDLLDSNFILSHTGEFTLEGSPETLTYDRIALSVSRGVNRISFGVESFDDDFLKDVGRRHTRAEVFETFGRIRANGIYDIDIDLIRGLPGYENQHLIGDLRAIAAAKPPSVTSYQYILKPGSLDAKRLERGWYSESDQLVGHQLFREGMSDLGYHWGVPSVDWFCLPEVQGLQHNHAKWSDDVTLYSLGQGAYGYVDGLAYVAHTSPTRYKESIKGDQLPIKAAIYLDDKERMYRSMVFGLKAGLSLSKYTKKHGIDPFDAPFAPRLKELIAAGGLRVAGDTIAFTQVGELFADWIMMQFFSPAQQTWKRS